MPPDKTEKCTACGGYQFSMNDGFKYCDRCGTLLENFEELVDEEAGLLATLGTGKIKTKKKKGDGEKKAGQNLQKNPSKKEIMQEALEKKSDFLKSQEVQKEELDIPHDSTPDYLYRLGLRIFAFTQILSKSGHMLVKELNFEPRVQPTILATFQRYLAHCQVAFCRGEQCGTDEKLRFVALMENLQFEEQAREEKRRKKLARKGKGGEALSKSAAAWTLLTQGNITENLDLDDSDSDLEDAENDENDPSLLRNPKNEQNPGNLNKSMENLELAGDSQNSEDVPPEDVTVDDVTMGFVRKVTTALSKEALRRASQMVLNLEILVAILHSALMASGYRSILTSDVVRWIREDRFRISRRSIRLTRQNPLEKTKKGEMEHFSKLDYDEPFLRLPLYEITRTCTIFHQSLNFRQKLTTLNFESLAARLIDNLNLPVDFLSRLLLLESIVPCDVSPGLQKQADVRMGYNFEKLAALSPKISYTAFMVAFGRKERDWQETDNCDEVLLSIDTKLIAYILLVFRLTFDLDRAPLESESEDVTSSKFDIDTWIHQLEMRVKCWQGHDMSMVLRSTCPIPDASIDPPFGPNYMCNEYQKGPLVWRLRRQVGFQKCVPSEMSFNSTSSLPTVFDIRHNRFPTERRQLEAVMAPLKFQKVVLKKEMDRDSKMYENRDEKSEKTFFRDFSTQKTSETANSFDEYFPCASHYSIYKRPDWIQNCTARKSQLTSKHGPYRFYLSNEACEDLLGVATSSFSPRFQFLLETLSLIIGEDPKAVYAAFVMLEMHLTSSENLRRLQDSLLRSQPITVDCQKFRNDTWHVECRRNIITEMPVETIEDLRYFLVSDGKESQNELDTSDYLSDVRHHGKREDLTSSEAQRVQKRIMKLCYNFEQFFGILAVKFW